MSNQFSNQDIERIALEELKAMEGTRIVVEVSPLELISIIGALQLSLRHPAYKGPSSILVRQFITTNRLHFVNQPALMEGIDRGFDERFDTYPEEGEMK